MKNNQNKLPICLKSFQIENYAGIIKTGIEDLPEDAQWIFLTGENGFGKTSVLQGIVIGFKPMEYIKLGFGESKAIVELRIVESGVENENTKYDTIVSNLDPNITGKILYEGSTEVEKIAAYGISRLEIAHDTTSNVAADKSARLYSLFRSDGVLLSAEAEMKIWEKQNPAYFKNLRNTLLKVLDKNLSEIFIDWEDNAKVKYVELDKTGNELPPVTFDKLASGYRSIVAMIGDLLIRFYKIYPRETPPEEFVGIVLIDELDVHLHPKMQKKMPGILSRVFPKMQFIASIHSPIPILGAPENSVFLKVNRTKEEGVTVEKLDLIDVKGLTPNTLFSSPIFDFGEIINDNQDKETEGLVTEDHYTDAVFAEVLEKKLRKMAKDANIDPEKILK